MFAMVSVVANPMLVDLSGHSLGFDWDVGGWMLVLLAALIVPCVASLLSAVMKSTGVSATRLKYRRPTLIVVRPPLLKNS